MAKEADQGVFGTEYLQASEGKRKGNGCSRMEGEYERDIICRVLVRVRHAAHPL